MAMTVNRSELWNDAVKLSSERFFESFVTPAESPAGRSGMVLKVRP